MKRLFGSFWVGIGYMLPAVAVIFLTGCYPPTTAPLVTLHYESESADGENNPYLMVYLPGNGDGPGAFAKNGFIEYARRRNLAVDVVAADLHLGYYVEGSFLRRLREDVIRPARARGYEQIWLVGNSLGGSGSLYYLREYPCDISGVVLLGPFLGIDYVIEKIMHEGGIRHWNPGNPEKGNHQRDFWLWIKDYAGHVEEYPPVYLGYGRDDRYAFSQEMLAEILPPDRVVAIDGGHDWATWKAIWEILLEKPGLRKLSGSKKGRERKLLVRSSLCSL